MVNSMTCPVSWVARGFKNRLWDNSPLGCKYISLAGVGISALIFVSSDTSEDTKFAVGFEETMDFELRFGCDESRALKRSGDELSKF